MNIALIIRIGFMMLVLVFCGYQPTNALEFEIHQLTDHWGEGYSEVSVYDGTIVWKDSDGFLYHWDGNEIKMLEELGSTVKQSICLYNGTIAWERSWGGSCANEIVYWDGTDVSVITSQCNEHPNPSLYNGTIAWVGTTVYSSPVDIYYWDGIDIRKITNNTSSWKKILEPSLCNGTIAWSWYDGEDYEIYYWDGNTIAQITNNSYEDSGPSLYNGTIAWHALKEQGNGFEIFYWDGNNTYQITDNSVNDFNPSLYDGNIAWNRTVDGYYQIYYWDGQIIYPVTNEPYVHHHNFSFHKDVIAWPQYDGHDSEIYYAKILAAPVISSFSINSGATTTISRDVTLNNEATENPTHYKASEDPSFTGAVWESYSGAPNFTLSPGSGEKTVYFKVKSENEESEVVSDTIILSCIESFVSQGTINNMNDPRKDTFTVNNMIGCDGLDDAVTALSTKTVHVEVGPFFVDIPGSKFILSRYGYYQYSKPGTRTSPSALLFRLFPNSESIYLYGANVSVNGIENPITVKVAIEDNCWEAVDEWRALPNRYGITYRLP